MKRVFRIGVIVTLMVLILGAFSGVVAADYGDNKISDPQFTSIGNTGSTTSSWLGEFVGSTVGGNDMTSDNGAKIKLCPANTGTLYAYIYTYDAVDLTYVSELTVTNTVGSGGATIGGVYAYYSTDKSNWQSLTKTSGVKTGLLKWDVSSLSGSYYIRFGISASTISSQTITTTLSSATATDISSAPVFSSASTLTSPIEVGDSTSTTVTYTAGYPTDTDVLVNWGDGSSDGGDSGDAFTHEYSTVGYYTVTCTASNTAYTTESETIGVVTVTPTITSVTTTGATFSGGSATVTPGTQVYFSANYDGAISSGNAFTWYVKESQSSATETAGSQVYSYTFDTAGAYTVKVKVSGSTGTSSYYTVGTVYAGSNTVTFNATSYQTGDIAKVTWSLNNPDYDDGYNLQIFSSDSTGIISGSSVINTFDIESAAVTSYNWNTNGSNGYYVAKIFKGTDGIATSSVVSVKALTSLTVTLSANAVTYKNSTVVTMYRDGQTAYGPNTTTTGSITFENVLTGTYTVTAVTDKYSQQSATVTLDGTASSINIDFVTGASTNTVTSGAGGMYSVTYVTFRVIDKSTGATVSGARISGSAVQATNPIEWMINWFGAAYGNSVIGTEIEGTSDDNGVVSFVMYPNLRYSLTLNHTGLSEPSTRTFSPSSLSAEYPWYITFPTSETGTTKNIKVTVNVSDTGLISAHYSDLTKSTSTVNLTVYEKNDNGDYNTSVGYRSGGGNELDLSVQLSDYSGQDVKIQVISQTTTYGQVTKTFYHTFVGPWLDLGLPNDVYIWICLLTAVLIGGVATFINSYAACFVICFVEWIYWFFGWFFQIGQVVALPLLIFATVLSVLFYMQSRK